MKIEQQFDVGRPREAVWEAMGDVYLVAECLPGASIAEDLGKGRYKGLYTIKLGPLAASFNGDVSIERNPEDWTAVVSGKGSDARSSSRASGSMTYRISPKGATTTQVDVVSEINLAGSLAQFGKAGVIQEIANRITAEFVRNFEAKLEALASSAGPGVDAPTAPRPPSAAPQAQDGSSLNAGALLWSIVRDRISSLFRMLGRRGSR
jgi:carbon monoxide dehydrogenase subunit G